MAHSALQPPQTAPAPPCLQPVQRAARPRAATCHDMGVNLRRFHAFVAQQVLHRADVRAVLQQVSGKTMA